MTHQGTITTNASSGKEYGEKCGKEGDIIDVYLDLEKYTLSFGVNGTDYGIAHKLNQNKEYRLALSLVIGRRVKLISPLQRI